MKEITLVFRDSNKTNKALFEPSKIILNSNNPEQNFSVKCEDGYQVDDFLFMGNGYTIVDLGNNIYCAKLSDTEIKENSQWYINFSIVEE